MDKPAISVIIPVYNTARSLPRCLDSVLSQSYQDFEVVIVDDGSPDDAGTLADDYARRYNQVTVIHQSNQGLAEARRIGIMAARGEWVVHVDSDDTLPHDALALLYGYAGDGSLDMAWGGHRRVTDSGSTVVRHHVTGVMSGRQFLDHVLDLRCICASWASISRRHLWLHDVFPPTQVRLPGEDVMIHIKLSQYAQRVGLFNDVVYNYHYNPQSLSIAGPLHRQDLWSQYFALIRDNLRQRSLLDELETRLRVMEVDRMSFCTRHINRDALWYRQVIAYPDHDFPAKHRLLHRLLRHPRLLRRAIALRRLLR